MKSNQEIMDDELIYSLLKNSPIPKQYVVDNISLFLKRQSLTSILIMHDLHKKILDVNGIVCEFGSFFGKNLVLFESLRGIYEPYNYTRKIVSFDTFAGFPNVDSKDGDSDIIKEGAYSVTEGYEHYLSQLLDYHERQAPIPHIKKYELVKGDATKTIKEYLKRNPETIIAFAYFDFDLYKPTKEVLEAILPHLTKGAIIGFDELNHHEFPGETKAFQEVLGINKFKICRDRRNTFSSYVVFE